MGAFGTFLLLVIFGAGVGFAMNRYGRGWLGRNLGEAAGVGDITYGLVGIAGSFMGYHIGLILGIYSAFVLYVLAVVGAGATVWLWRGR